MTPKEKAEELVNKFYNYSYSGFQNASKQDAKQCALIAVDEIIGTGALGELWLSDKTDIQYWQEVKQEIDNITN